MAIKYSIDIMTALKEKGFTTYQLTKGENAPFSPSTLQKFRNQDTNISLKVVDRLCALLECQPQDLIKFYND